MFFLTKEEKIAKAREIYKNDAEALTMAVFEIEGVDKIKDPDEYYRRALEVCAEHNLDFNIPN